MQLILPAALARTCTVVKRKSVNREAEAEAESAEAEVVGPVASPRAAGANHEAEAENAVHEVENAVHEAERQAENAVHEVVPSRRKDNRRRDLAVFPVGCFNPKKEDRAPDTSEKVELPKSRPNVSRLAPPWLAAVEKCTK